MAAPESPKKGQLYGNTAELFVRISLDILLFRISLTPL